jgi:AcrR family transcriptional regulator
LLDTAIAAFAEHGYHGTSVADIAQRAGVAKGVVYWYFESKEALFLELLSSRLEEVRVVQNPSALSEADPLLRIENGIRSALVWLERNREVLAIIQLAATDERFVAALQANMAAMADDLAAHVKEAIVVGRIPDGDPHVLAYAVLGAVDALARTFLGRPGAWDDGVADTAVAFCVGGLLASRSGGATPS